MDIQKKIVFLFLPFFCIGISFPVHAVINEEELEALVERTVLGQEGSFKPTTSLTNEAYDTTPVTAKDTKAPEAKTTHGTAPQEETERIEDVVARMYKNGLTVFSTPEGFQPNNAITREEMAKFIVSFSLLTKRQRSPTGKCGFKDIYQAQKTLIPYVISACDMGLMKGTDGEAKPKKNLTKAEAVTTVMRVIRSDLSTDADPRYKNYYTTARAYGVTRDTIENMTAQVTRGQVGIMVYRAYKFQE